ncbi:MAG: hypothetical protein JO165_11525 [Candidatus Eremiobacteraeota bacterium]|nr:hypothetical protein [Candidatus Eremiobacteraeota bacterium]
MTRLLRVATSALLASLITCPVVVSAAISGNGQTVFKDVPVAPGSFPDYAPSEFMLKGGANSKPQAFNYGIGADRNSVLDWYLRRLPQLGWHLREARRNYPRKGIDAIIADRPGEAVTIVLSSVLNATKVNVVKLVSTK